LCVVSSTAAFCNRFLQQRRSRRAMSPSLFLCAVNLNPDYSTASAPPQASSWSMTKALNQLLFHRRQPMEQGWCAFAAQQTVDQPPRAIPVLARSALHLLRFSTPIAFLDPAGSNYSSNNSATLRLRLLRRASPRLNRSVLLTTPCFPATSG
jgi:hypothetical protein